MDYDMDNGFKVIRMMKLRDQQVGVYKGSDNWKPLIQVLKDKVPEFDQGIKTPRHQQATNIPNLIR